MAVVTNLQNTFVNSKESFMCQIIWPVYNNCVWVGNKPLTLSLAYIPHPSNIIIHVKTRSCWQLPIKKRFLNLNLFQSGGIRDAKFGWKVWPKISQSEFDHLEVDLA